MTPEQEKLKEELLSIKTLEEYEEKINKFSELPFDREVVEHISDLYGPCNNPIKEGSGICCEGIMRKKL